MNRFPITKKILTVLFICFIGYWIIKGLVSEDNFEKLPAEVARDLEQNLLGHWVRPKENGMMLVTFGKIAMRISDMSVGGAKPEEISVIYNQTESGWSIDFVSTFEVAENSMMVLFLDVDTIMFGAPGLPFVEFKRTREVAN